MKNSLEQVVRSAILGAEEFVGRVREKWVEKRADRRDIPLLRQVSKWPELSSIEKEAEIRRSFYL